MSKYRKKSGVVEATLWRKNGDHPKDECGTFDNGEGPFQGEGHVVRYYRVPECDGQEKCKYCGDIMHNHGWIDTLEFEHATVGLGYIVCPGDWVITGTQGDYYPCKPYIFEATYEIVLDQEQMVMVM